MFKKFLAKLIRKYERRKAKRAKTNSANTEGASVQSETDNTIVMNRDLFFKQVDAHKNDYETKTDLPVAGIHSDDTNDIPFGRNMAEINNPDMTKMTDITNRPDIADITDIAGTTEITELSASAKEPLQTEETEKELKERKNKEKKKSPLRRGAWAVCLTMILTGVFTLSVFLWYVFIYVDGEFDLSYLDNSLNYTTVLYGKQDGKDVEIEQLHGTENRIWANIDEIPKNMQHAVIAIEDERFYKHNGVDLKRTAHAVLNFFNPGSTSSFGGSTITQQLVKNLTDDDDHTITRKIQEMRRAWYLESQYKKDQILEVYLNTIYLSQGCYGVQTASNKYFGKDVKDLTLAECACLASITKSPSAYDPITNMEKNKERAANVLNKMVELGFISEEEAEAAKNEQITISDGSNTGTNSASIKSYYVDAVTESVINDLINIKGYSEVYAETLVYSGGLQIFTPYDADVQKCVDSVYSDPDNFPKISAKDKDGNTVTPQSAMAVIDNSTGGVVAIAGGIGEKTTARGQNRATMTYRQPGSSIKPLSTYAPGIEFGVSVDGNNALSPSSMILDWYIDEAKQYPKNQSRYESNKKVTLQAGVAQSLNTVAARVNVAVGFKRSINFMIDNLGFTSLITSDMNRSHNDENVAALGLGGLTKGVNVVEMAAAYASFPNDGTYTKPYFYTKVVDQNGRVLLENKVESHTAMTAETARVMNSLLSYAATSGTGTPANFGTTEVAGKTGTTSDDYDRWFAGYTAYYTGVVWYGYDYNKTVYYSGANPAATTWKKVMSKIHNGLAYKALTKPTTLVSAEYCFDTGMLLTENCPNKATGSFLPDGVPTEPCTLHTAPVEEVPSETPEDQTTPGTDTENPPADTNNPDTEQPDSGNETVNPDNGGNTDTGQDTSQLPEKEPDKNAANPW